MTIKEQPIANELERALTADSAYASPSHILEGISDELAHKKIPGAPHTIYAELWHIVFWQQISLDWVNRIKTPNPDQAALGFPSESDIAKESWQQLCRRFFAGNKLAGEAAANDANLNESIQCPSPAGQPTRTMTVREQLESLTAHNGYHFGRIVLLRQLNGAWPPKSGGFTW